MREARWLTRMFAILWFVRGHFTPEVLYNRSFNIGHGLAIGLCMLAKAARNREPAATLMPLPLIAQGRLATGR